MQDGAPGKGPFEGGKSTIGEYLRIIQRRKWFALLFVALVLVATLLWTLRQTPIYRATATLLIATAAPAVLGRDVEEVVEVGTGNYWADRDYYETQYRVLQSRSVAEAAVRQMGLHQNPGFMGVPPSKKRGWRGASVTEAAERLMSFTVVQPIKNSQLVNLHVDDSDPRRAALLAKAIAEAYTRQNLDFKLSSTVQALDWLSTQLDQLRDRLERSEVALHAFKRDNTVLSLSLEDQQNILSSQIRELATSLTSTKTKRVELEAHLGQIEAVRDVDPLELPAGVLLENPTLVSLKGAYSAAAQEEAVLAARYGPNHPTYREAAARTASIRDRMMQEVRAVVGSVTRDVRATRETEGSLAGLLARAQAEALQLNLLEIEYNRLAREEKNNEDLYGLVLKRTKETDLSKLLRVNNIRMLDPPILPVAPVRPSLPLNLALALIFGLLGGIALAFFVEHLDSSIASKEDVEGLLDLPFLGVIPRVGTGSRGYGYGYGYGHTKSSRKQRSKKNGHDREVNKDLYVASHPKSAMAECCRSIRTNLLFMSAAKKLRTILVTSSGPQEGKTSTSVSVAIAMAQGNSRTLVVDTDMRRPRLHKVFGVGSDVGLSSTIIGSSSLEEAIKPTGIDNLWVLPCGPIPPNPAELLGSPAFREIISCATELYDRIVFDSPPVALVTDAPIISTMVDGVMLVVRSRRTQRELALATRDQLTKVGARLLGVVLNDVDLDQRGRYYHPRYYYYYSQRDTAEVSGSEPLSDAQP